MTDSRRYYENTTETQSSSSESSSQYSTTSTTTDWREMLQEYYEDNLGNRMPYPIANLIQEAIDGGMTPEVVKLAIDETMFAPRPSPHYLRAVLKRWMTFKVYDTVDYALDKSKWHAEKARRKRFYNDEDY